MSGNDATGWVIKPQIFSYIYSLIDFQVIVLKALMLLYYIVSMFYSFLRLFVFGYSLVISFPEIMLKKKKIFIMKIVELEGKILQSLACWKTSSV